jgi:hypothetical protein
MIYSIEVENKFEMSRRGLQVRRKSFEGTMEEQRISCPVYESGDVGEESRMVKFSIGKVEGEEDYLEISVDNQQEELGPCKIDIWSNGPVTFIPPAAASVTVLPPKDVETLETNTTLRIPSGLPTWKLEIMSPPKQSRDEEDGVSGLIIRDEGSTTNVTVGDEPPGGWG